MGKHSKKKQRARQIIPYEIGNRSPFGKDESESEIEWRGIQESDSLHNKNKETSVIEVEMLKKFCETLPLPNTTGHHPIFDKGTTQDGKARLFDMLAGTDISSKHCYNTITVDWREQHLQVVPGVNFLATCKNYECSMYLENVICPKGLYPERNGYCSMDSEIFKIKCPVCRKRISPDRSIGIGFFRCTFKVSYMLRASKHRSVEMRATGETLMLAKCSKPNDEMFLYLELRLSPI